VGGTLDSSFAVAVDHTFTISAASGGLEFENERKRKKKSGKKGKRVGV